MSVGGIAVNYYSIVASVNTKELKFFTLCDFVDIIMLI